MDKFRKTLYRVVLSLVGKKNDYRGNQRTILGASPYPGRGILMPVLLKFHELARFLASPRWSREGRKATRNLKDSKSENIALLLGNGPSVNKLNTGAIRDFNVEIWVVNDFYKVDCSKDLKIDYYVLSDMDYFSGPNFENRIKLVPLVNYAASHKPTFVLPHWMREAKSTHILHQFEIIYFDDREIASWSRNTNPCYPRGYIGLTLYKALAFTIFLNYRKIFILGMDNTEFIKYRSDSHNSILLDKFHGYHDDGSNYDFSNHFLDGLAGALISYAHTFGDLNRFKGPIFNLDVESLSMAFQKIPNHSWIRK
jgi:hypothetical protein